MHEELEAHPHAGMFPMMESGGFDALRRDIRENGLHEPIVLLDGKILDGRNRYRAMRFIDPNFGPRNAPKMFKQFEGHDPLEFVVSKNLYRRHLNESQRAMVAAKLSLANPGKNRWQQNMSAPKAGKLLNVSAGLVNEAKRLVRVRSYDIPKIESGESRIGRRKFDGCVSAAVGVELRHQFHDLCNDLGRSNTDVLTELIRMAVERKVALQKSVPPSDPDISRQLA